MENINLKLRLCVAGRSFSTIQNSTSGEADHSRYRIHNVATFWFKFCVTSQVDRK